MSLGAESLRVQLEVDGERHEAVAPTRQLLVHFLRDTLGIRAPHIGCDTGHCGACTIRLDGRPVKSCLVLAVQADGARVETAAGLAGDDEPAHPMQRAFARRHGLQCGYCTPAMLIVATDLLERVPEPDDEQIRQALKGVLCRCTGYQNIVAAVREAVREAAG